MVNDLAAVATAVDVTICCPSFLLKTEKTNPTKTTTTIMTMMMTMRKKRRRRTRTSVGTDEDEDKDDYCGHEVMMI